MKLETVKSFILVVLIGISIILSYTLWSYQPNSNQTIGGDISDNEMDAGGRDDLTKRDLIKPSDIIFHTGQEHYGFIDAKNQDLMFEKMQQEWDMTDFEVYSEYSGSLDHSTEAIEIIFPEEVPMKILGSLFTFGQNEIEFPSWSMKRILVSFMDDSKSLKLEFISDESNQGAFALVNDTADYEEVAERIAELDEGTFTEYLVINKESNPVYFPAERVEMHKYSITPTGIKPSIFVNILFTNPSVVRETRSMTIGVTYFTDNRQMNVYQDGMRMEYKSHVVPAADEFNRNLAEEKLLEQSMLNINSHSGWTQKEHLGQEYRLERIDSDANKVSFQMYYKGYPVFNNVGLDTIEQVWGVNQNNVQLNEYNRPLFLFENEFFPDPVDDLPSGEAILAYLESNPDISIENIQDVTIGYELNYQRDDQKSEYIEMTPAWYKKENNVWQKLYFTDETIPRGGN